MLTLYGDPLSQPTRAVLLFCLVNKIEVKFENVIIFKMQHKTPEFRKINPLGLVPAIDDGGFKLTESHAIMRYLAQTRTVADHWYPTDATRRAQIDSLLDWHHLNLRRGSMTLVFNKVLKKNFGLKANPVLAAEGKKILEASLAVMEKIWLTGDRKFLANGSLPSIADLSMACEVKQLQFLAEDEIEELLGPCTRVRMWMTAVETATAPHFTEVHKRMDKITKAGQAQRDSNQKIESIADKDTQISLSRM